MTTESTINPSSREVTQPARLGLKLTPDNTLALTSPPWIKSVVSRIDHLLGLPADWDREGGLPLDFETAMESLNFLLSSTFHGTPAPQVVPTSSGGLQVEWHVGGCDLEISFAPGLRATFFHLSADGKEAEGTVEQEEDLVAEFIRGLSARDTYNSLGR